jgi:hypothetical protein
VTPSQLAEYLLLQSPEASARRAYMLGRISVEDFEQVLDAVMLGNGMNCAVRCPRCGNLVKAIGSTDKPGMVAVRCNGPNCYFVGYAEVPIHA